MKRTISLLLVLLMIVSLLPMIAYICFESAQKPSGIGVRNVRSM